jgi:hypothetical protein
VRIVRDLFAPITYNGELTALGASITIDAADANDVAIVARLKRAETDERPGERDEGDDGGGHE